MFLVSKLLWLVAQPLSLAFALAVVAWVCLWLGRRRAASGAVGGLLVVLFVTLYTTAGTVALQALEQRFPRPTADPAALSCLIVLGGAFTSDVNTIRGGIEMNQAADRYVEALRLAQRYPTARILVSGGDGSLAGRFDGDAVTAGRFFAQFAIGPDRLIQEPASRNTAENIDNSRSLLEAAGLANCLLITSAYHMPRAVGLMRRAGMAVTPWPTDFRTTGTARLGLDFTQPALNAQLTATALREWLGLAVNHLSGRSPVWVPGP